MVADILRGRLDALRNDGPSPGRGWCEHWTDAVDDALVALHGASVHRDQLTLAATGGYGRRELCPGSDIDLLILHDRLEEPALAVVVRELVYPLWDAGLEVGYAVRDRREASRVRDPDDVTATLDARFVSGNPALLGAVRDTLIRDLHRKPKTFLAALADANLERHARRGDAAEALEPDLKDGAGGLRDVQSLRWAAAALVGEPRLDALVSAAYLGAADRARLVHAYDRVLAERVALHLSVEHKTDVLGFEQQPEVAARLAYEDGNSDLDTASHRLLTDHFLAARVVEHVHRRAWALIIADVEKGRRRRRVSEDLVDGFPVADGVLGLAEDIQLVDAELPVRLFAALAETQGVLGRDAAQVLRREAEDLHAPLEWTRTARDRFIRTLWRGRPALDAAAELDDTGLLSAIVPEWEPLRGRAQRNPYHRYSLDRHALHAATGLGDLVRHEEWAATTLEEVEDRDALMVGALLHDVGKAHGEPHVETGRPVAAAIARRLGLPASSIALIDRMVELHLLLPRTATRRDLADPDVIESVARAVGDRETLACLHLLAAADGRATGPGAWSEWTAALVEQLVVRVRAALDRDTRNDLADRAMQTARAAQRSAIEERLDPELVRTHLAALPMRYATVVPPEVVVQHASLVRELGGGADLAASALAHGDITRLLVAARDRPGLLADVAGTVTVCRGSVLEAHAHTRNDGLAVQFLVLAPPDPAEPDWHTVLESALAERPADPDALAEAVSRRRGYSRPASPGVEVETMVRVEHTPRATVVELKTRDRPGLLHLAARLFTDLGYDIDTVKASVQGPQVTDTFYVRRTDGGPVDADAESELELAFLSALGEVALADADEVSDASPDADTGTDADRTVR